MLRLFRREDDYMIVLGQNELMSSARLGRSASCMMTCERLGQRAPHLLIGGYGMGFTLRAALVCLEPDARITLAELVPKSSMGARADGGDHGRLP